MALAPQSDNISNAQVNLKRYNVIFLLFTFSVINIVVISALANDKNSIFL